MLPVLIKRDTGFNPAVTEHEVPQHDTDTAQTALREHSVWLAGALSVMSGSTQCGGRGSPSSTLSALTSPRGHQVEGSLWQR